MSKSFPTIHLPSTWSFENIELPRRVILWCQTFYCFCLPFIASVGFNKRRFDLMLSNTAGFSPLSETPMNFVTYWAVSIHTSFNVVSGVIITDLLPPCTAIKLAYLQCSLYLRVQKNSAKWCFVFHLPTVIICSFEASISTWTSHLITWRLKVIFLINTCYAQSI